MKNLWPQEEGPEQTELMKQCFSVNQVKGLQTPTMVRFESPPSSFITVAQLVILQLVTNVYHSRLSQGGFSFSFHIACTALQDASKWPELHQLL